MEKPACIPSDESLGYSQVPLRGTGPFAMQGSIGPSRPIELGEEPFIEKVEEQTKAEIPGKQGDEDRHLHDDRVQAFLSGPRDLSPSPPLPPLPSRLGGFA
jgi:hypothetical protein